MDIWLMDIWLSDTWKGDIWPAYISLFGWYSYDQLIWPTDIWPRQFLVDSALALFSCLFWKHIDQTSVGKRVIDQGTWLRWKQLYQFWSCRYNFVHDYKKFQYRTSLKVPVHWRSLSLKMSAQRQTLDQGILKGEVSLYRWPLTGLESAVWRLSILLFICKDRLIQTSQTEGRQCSDTSPFSIPWPDRPCTYLFPH
jgi:hypothetical protein